ncbi:MAG: DoxX family protein [Flavobacterium sp.]|nr:DoxX family protein [Flavobacterium sp.]
MTFPWHLYLMGAFYFFAGINHFRKPRLYLKIIPPYLPYPKLINAASGLSEIILGIALCIPLLSTIAAWGIIIMLIAIFPANIYMFTNDKARLGLPRWIVLSRLPLQIVLIIWAYCYA